MSGRVYENVGIITCVRPPIRGIDSHLWACLKILVDQQQLHIEINSVDTGKHAPHSRHYRGLAVDIWKAGDVNLPTDGVPLPLATVANRALIRAVYYLRAHGWRHEEGGPWSAVLLGEANTPLNHTSVSHATHLHLSIFR